LVIGWYCTCAIKRSEREREAYSRRTKEKEEEEDSVRYEKENHKIK